MKKVISILVVVLAFAFNSNAQDKMNDNAVTTIALEQTKGEFVQKALTVSEGTYVFEVANNHADHIQTAYVTQVVKDGETQKTQATTLAKGEYVYFCPLNPTPQYTLTVQ
jgi:plastocyanin